MTTVGAGGSTYFIHPAFDDLIINNAIVKLYNNMVIYTKGLTVSNNGIVTGNGSIAYDGVNAVTLAGGSSAVLFFQFSQAGATADLNITGGTHTLPASATIGRDLAVSGTGTVVYANNITAPRDLTISSAAVAVVSTVNVGHNLSLQGTGTTLYAGLNNPSTTANTVPNVIAVGDVGITNGARLSSYYASTNTEYYLYLTAPNVTIDSMSSIDVSGQGYPYGVSGGQGYFRSLGNVNTLSKALGGCNDTGSSYGGEGGGPAGTMNATYGSFKAPVYLGTAGYDQNGSGGSGGGAVRLDISGTLTLDGEIIAKGNGDNTESPGSGGSVYIQTGTLAGAGSISANGGDTVNTNRGSGGGGRVALYYTTGAGNFASNSLIATNAKAFGGNAPTDSYVGAAGTVFFKAAGETYGNLSVDNGGRGSSANPARTVLPNTTATVVGSTDLTSVTVGSGFTNSYGYNNFLSGLFINPKLTQNASTTLTDDTRFAIASNTSSVLNVASGNPSSLAGSGNSMRLVLALDSLSVVGKATLDFGGNDIYAVNGDISSGGGNFSLDGNIYARVLDVGSGTLSITSYGNLTNTTNVCAGAAGAGVTLSCP